MADIPDLSKPPKPSADQPAPEEVAALLNGLEKAKREVAEQPSDLEIACAGGMNVVTIPAKFTVSYKDVRFAVDEFRAWAWTPFGVLAIGHWEDAATTECHILVHGDQIEEIELQMKPYEDAVREAQEKAAAEQGEQSEDAEEQPEEAEASEPEPDETPSD